jgi:hypothetical protein
MQRLYIATALAAGFLGGLASRYVTPFSVFAQTPTATPRQEALKEVRGQSFVFTDPRGNVVGTLKAGLSPDARKGAPAPVVVLMDETGKVIWSTAGGDQLRIQPLRTQ